MSNEMWLQENQDSHCTHTGGCWIEAGFYTQVNQGEDYIWAHQDSNGNYIPHDLGQIKSGDYGQQVIVKEWSTGTNKWGVYMSSPNFYQYNTDIGQTYSPLEINIGSEVGGDPINASDASANNVDFTMNEYEQSGTWAFQYHCNNGQDINNPPSLNYVDCATGESNYGGDYQTYCCSYTGSMMPVHPPTQPAQGPTTQPTRTVSNNPQAQGRRAITPHQVAHTTASTPTFTIADAASYVGQHAMPLSLDTTHPQVVSTSFLTDQAVRALVGDNPGLNPTALVCYVTVRGTFTVSTPSGREETFHKGAEIFDAHTGNLLMWEFQH
jgi:hypothetical protein